MKLLIQNFKCFQEQEISLGKITILAGSNSVGKSSIIQSILLTRTAWEVKKDFPLPLVGPFLLELGTATEILNKVKGSTGEIKFIYKKIVFLLLKTSAPWSKTINYKNIACFQFDFSITFK